MPFISAGQFGGPTECVTKVFGSAIEAFVNGKQNENLEVNMISLL